MSIDIQKSILTRIAENMISKGYTSEQRDYIVELIMRCCLHEIEAALTLYPASERPDKEFLANKIASHALLDRSSKEENKIGFINEFVLGYFVAKNIINQKEWLNDDLRFLEPAVVSYQPRVVKDKVQLLDCIRASLEFTPISYRIDFTAKLIGTIDFPLSTDEAEGLELDNVEIGSFSVKDFQFNDCIFRACNFRLKNMSNVTFLNCKFYGENIASETPEGTIYILGDMGESRFLRDAIQMESQINSELTVDRPTLLERHVLEKFWPIGREKLMHKHRSISGICTGNGDYKPDELYDTILRLKKTGILLQPNHASFVELNFDRLSNVRTILGRQ
jgi:hypothetical protein